MNMMSATYSPEDNKLRLYPLHRLGKEDYERAKALGFKWAPKQELFFASMWTPEREDFLIDMCGEVEDEDKSLADRAEERADRFAEYSDKRKADAERADKAVKAICEHIPLGQPILIGHHSEKRARKDAERIDNGMRRMVQMWETAEYWHRRAAGALAAAKYKELPASRARRIKKLEAELRKMEKSKAGAEKHVARWRKPELTIEEARIIAGFGHAIVATVGNCSYSAWDVLRPDGERYATCPAMTVEEVRAIIFEKFDRSMPKLDRWIAHYENRIAYEKALLGETGYVEPPKRATKAVLPILNYRKDVYELRNPYRNETMTLPALEMTKAEFADINKDYKGTRLSKDGTHRLRSVMIRSSLAVAFLTDSKAHPEPGVGPIEGADAEKVAARINNAQEKIERVTEARAKVLAHNKAVTAAVRSDAPKPEPFDRAPLEAAREIAAAGVKIAVAPQLFPTPPELAARMVEIAGIGPGDFVLEPSAGTGNILREIKNGAVVVAVEINPGLFGRLPADVVSLCGNFLEVTPEIVAGMIPAFPGAFDAIVMNPPFENGADIRHIKHAASMLKPGGTLVAICAGGPRQKEQLEPLAALWEPLPPGTFAAQGTNVNTVLLTIER